MLKRYGRIRRNVFLKKLWMFVGKHRVLLDKRDLVVKRGCGLGKGEAAFIQDMERV